MSDVVFHDFNNVMGPRQAEESEFKKKIVFLLHRKTLKMSQSVQRTSNRYSCLPVKKKRSSHPKKNTDLRLLYFYSRCLRLWVEKDKADPRSVHHGKHRACLLPGLKCNM